MHRILLAGALGLLAAAGRPACAQWSVSAELERFRWAESVSPSITETGPRLALGLQWVQDREAPWRLGYGGRLYSGSTDYRGAFLFSGAPARGTTEYLGLTHELQAIHRLPLTQAADAELVAGIGWDYWERELSAFQKEEYSVAFLRLGGRFGARSASGWFAGGGLKLPMYARLDANLRSIGFDRNPAFRPEGRPSLYADLGYRYAGPWSLIGYYDSYRFGASDPELVTDLVVTPGAQFLLHQPKSRVDTFGVRLQYRF
jgi:hypothetical protein